MAPDQSDFVASTNPKADQWQEQFRGSDGKLPPMKRCPDCALEMPDIAKKCSKCGYQRFRFWSSSAPTILSLIVAIISVSINAAPILEKWLLPDVADPRVAFLDAQPDGSLELSILNDGRAPSVLESATLLILIGSNDDQNKSHRFRVNFLKSDNESDFRTFKSKDLRTVTGRLGSQDLSIARTALNSMPQNRYMYCEIDLRFAGLVADQESDLPVDCNSLQGLSSVLPALSNPSPLPIR